MASRQWRETEKAATRRTRGHPPGVHPDPATLRATTDGPLDLLTLQRLAGNRAVTSLLTVQCMPTRSAIVTTLGKPSKLPTEGKKYKRLLQAIDDYHNQLKKPFLIGAYQKQFAELIALIAAIKTRADAYTGFTGAKATYMLGTLAAEITSEQQLVNRTLVKLISDPYNLAITPTLGGLLLLQVGKTPAPVRLDDRNKVGNQRGGSSEVTEYALGGGNAFFKPGKDTLETRRDDEIIAELKRKRVPDDKLMDALNPLQNERELAVNTLGINPNDARMGNRDTAMFRLNQLLGENVIARAQKAVQSDGTSGSLMDKAKGVSGGSLMAQGKMAKDASEQARTGQGAVNQQDPNLMRLLSKLQVIDLLAYQVDRNPNNYWIRQDPRTGEVVGITGIDNDMALGTTDTLDRVQELPGFSRYVDRELAERINTLDLTLLPAVFGDLLSPEEITALTERFLKLRAKLGEHTTQLLNPDEWTDAVGKGLLQEQQSYWYDIDYNKGKYGPNQ